MLEYLSWHISFYIQKNYAKVYDISYCENGPIIKTPNICIIRYDIITSVYKKYKGSTKVASNIGNFVEALKNVKCQQLFQLQSLHSTMPSATKLTPWLYYKDCTKNLYSFLFLNTYVRVGVDRDRERKKTFHKLFQLPNDLETSGCTSLKSKPRTPSRSQTWVAGIKIIKQSFAVPKVH